MSHGPSRLVDKGGASPETIAPGRTYHAIHR